MHAIEKVQGNGEIENCGPYAEAKCLLFQAVVVLWPAAKGRKDPQLKERKRFNELFRDVLATWGQYNKLCTQH